MLGDSLKRRRGGEPPPDRESWRKRLGRLGVGSGFSWPRWLGVALGVLLISYGVGYLLSTLVLFPRPETAGAGIAVPDLTGRPVAEAESTIVAAGLTVGEVRGMASMVADSGRVLAQHPVPGQQQLPGSVISLGVSTGAPELKVPPVAGLGQEAARELLGGVGFDVEVQQARSASFPAGVVTRAEPPAGTPLELPAVVTLVVSTGAPPDTVAEDTLPDSLQAGGSR